jgi:hypothetical protein
MGLLQMLGVKAPPAAGATQAPSLTQVPPPVRAVLRVLMMVPKWWCTRVRRPAPRRQEGGGA